MTFQNFKKLIFKFLWLIFFKIKYQKSPKSIITSFEHRKLKKYIFSPNLILDIGFNRGQFSSLALEYWPNVSLIAFDPHPYACKNASMKLKKSYFNFFEFRNKGISSKESKVQKLYLAKKSDNTSLLEPTDLNKSLFNKTRIFKKEICNVSKIKDEINPKLYKNNWLLKIDVQGSELDVLKSISQEQYIKIKWIYIEVTDFSLYKNQASRKELKNFLETQEFKLTKTFNKNFLDGKLVYADLLFTK